MTTVTSHIPLLQHSSTVNEQKRQERERMTASLRGSTRGVSIRTVSFCQRSSESGTSTFRGRVLDPGS